MFVLQDEVAFDWPVDVAMPSSRRPGTHEVQRFTARFAALPIEEARALAAEAEGAEPGRQDELLRRVLVGWADVTDEAGAEVPFTPGALDAALRWAWVRIALYRAYAAAVSGEGVKARRQGN